VCVCVCVRSPVRDDSQAQATDISSKRFNK